MPQFRDENGVIWEGASPDDPNLRVVSAPSQGRIIPNAVDPTAAYDVPKVQADLDNTRSTMADRNADNARADRVEARQARVTAAALATQPYDVRKAAADAALAEAKAAEATKGGETKKSDKAIAARRLLDMLDGEGGIASQYEENFRGGGVAGLNEYNPFRAANQNFDVKANAMLPFAKKLLRTPGEGAQSDKEAQDYRDQLPRASFRDSTNEQLISDLRATALSVLESEGYDPSAYDETKGDFRPNAMTDPRLVSGGGASAAGAGATQTVDQYPPEVQQEHAALMQRLMASGRMDPDAYAQGKAEIMSRHGFQADAAADREWAAGINRYLDGGGSSVPDGIMPPERDMTGGEQAINNLANNPLGGAVTGAGDAFSLGALTAIAPEGMRGVSDANPVSTTLGQIGGSIAGVGLIGGAGARTLGKMAPSLLGGGAKAQLGRNVAADATYGAGYGSVTEGDPMTGALLAGAGSVGGQAIGKGLGSAVGGLKLGEAAQSLAARGVRLTGGRRMGNAASALEDKAASIPFVGDMVKARQLDSFEDFNRAAFEEAGKPIGYKPSLVGEAGVEQFQNAVGNAYDSATAGVSVPGDDQFFDDLTNMQALKMQLPEEFHGRIDRLMENHTAAVSQGGQLSGEQYQRAMRALKTARGKASTIAEEFEQPYRDITTAGMNAFDGLMRRNGGEEVVAGLDRANAANKGFKILEDATLDRARNGTRTGEVGIFAPSQLVDAARKSEKKYGATGLKALGQDGQRVLPSTVPNSGTADRLAAMALPGAAGLGLGGGAGLALGGPDGAQTGAGVSAAAMAALALGGTRGSQRVIGKVLNDRSATAKKLGYTINRNRGLFGSATLPFTLMQ